MKDDPHVKSLNRALKDGDERAIDQEVSNVLNAIHQDDPTFDTFSIAAVNDALRNSRQHAYVKAFAEALLIENRNTFDTDKHYAQALIDTDMPMAALAPLLALAQANKEDFSKFSEAMGLIGRVHKDLFMNSKDKHSHAAVKHFNKSLDAYAQPWRIDRGKCSWHASNLLALISFAQAEKIEIPDEFDSSEIAENLERVILEKPENERNYWDWASLAESRLGRSDWVGASEALSVPIEKGEANVFQLNGTLRQFKDVWLLPARGVEASNIITWLERNLLAVPNGGVSLDSDDIDRQLSAKDVDLEALHSHHKMRSHSWIKDFLKRGDNIGSIIDKHSGHNVGTCCVIDRKYIEEKRSGELICLTNDHVLSNHIDDYKNKSKKPLLPENAAVKFTSSDSPEKKFFISEIIWSSNFDVHDACMFRLAEDPPVDVENLPIVDYVPTIDSKTPQEIFLISHPEKDELSYSFQNTDLVDHDATSRGKKSLIPGLIHYTTPSIPGSSGGVALNGMLEMVGLHHAGVSGVNRLNKELKAYEVNEAIWIQPILNAARQGLIIEEKRWGEKKSGQKF